MSLLVALLSALAVYSAGHLVTGSSHRAAQRPVLGRRLYSSTTLHKDFRRPRLGSAAWLAQAGAPISSAQFAIACALSGSATGLSIWFIVRVPVLCALGALAGAGMPVGYWAARRSRLQVQMAGAWPDAVRYLVGVLGSGIATLHEGLEELGRNGPQPLRPAFSRYARLSGRVGDKQALEILRAELGDPVADPVLIALRGAVDEGTGTALRALADIGSQITADLQLAERARTAQSQSRLATWGCFVVPYMLLAFLCLTNVTYRSYFSTPGGFLLVAIGACLSTLGLGTCLRLARPVRPDRRVFKGRGHA
ncbi:MAG TPA: hypothetical protein VFN61_07135 [Acidimicrobiales bacterium]|nr:hypothetical protein [Acidimicrobiales bacterium]